MGRTIVEMVVDALNTWGIRADRACPGTWMPEIGTVAAAVQLSQLDQKEKTAQVLICVLVPAVRGAAGAEDSALAVCQWMNDLGGVCQQKKAEYLPAPDLFCVEVYAKFRGQETAIGWVADTGDTIDVVVNATRVTNAVTFRASRKAEGDLLDLTNARWHFRLEEMVAPGVAETDVPAAEFSVQVIRNNRTELFIGCVLTSHSWEATSDGLRQIWEGTATEMEIL